MNRRDLEKSFAFAAELCVIPVPLSDINLVRQKEFVLRFSFVSRMTIRAVLNEILYRNQLFLRMCLYRICHVAIPLKNRIRSDLPALSSLLVLVLYIGP